MSPDPGNAGADVGNPQTWNGYAYVGNNPLNYIDPDGLGFFSDLWSVVETAFGLYNTDGVQLTNTEPWNEMPPVSSIGGGGPLNTGDVFGTGNTGPFINNILQPNAPIGSQLYKFYADAIGYLLLDPWMAGIIADLQYSPRVYRVNFIRNGNDVFHSRNRIVDWDPRGSLRPATGGCQSAALGLGHELAHAWEYDKYPFWSAKQFVTPSPQYNNQLEKWAITGPETSAVRTLRESPRNNHAGTPTVDPNAVSRTCAGTYPY